MAEALAIETGEPFAKTHQVVGSMIHTLMDEKCLHTGQMTSGLMKPASMNILGYEVIKTDEEIAGMLDPLACLNAKVTGGTPKPDDTKILLENGKKQRLEDEIWLQKAKQRIADAYAQAGKACK